MILVAVDEVSGESVPVLDARTNDVIVTETRAAAPFRALPREISERILGNEKTGVVGLEHSKAFLVQYQDFIGPYVSAVRCWKCGRPICAYQPALRKVEGSRSRTAGEVTVMTTVDGKEMVVGALLPFNHYREGLFSYRTSDGRAAQFSYLHCADCHIKNEDGEDLLACLLGQMDARRDAFKSSIQLFTDDQWAQQMLQWSDIALVGKTGPSLSPSDLMKGNI